MAAHFPTPSLAETLIASGCSSSSFAAAAAVFDDVDLFEDSCSICLEPFTPHDPSTITTCKHEYHLQCILEWSQRSKECPICWRMVTLQDPNSQELLNAVEAERSMRSKSSATSPTVIGSREGGLVVGNDFHMESDSDESFMQRIAALMMSRDREVHERDAEISNGFEQSTTPVHSARASFHRMPSPSETTDEDCVFTSYETPFGSVLYPTSHNVSPAAVDIPDNTEKSLCPGRSSFSEAFRSKLHSASTRYKDSISKGSKSLKEKINRNSVKELTKGVQRDMSAGVARLIGRLDLNSKRSGSSVSDSDGGVMKSALKGKGVQEEGITPQDDSSNEEVYDLGTIPGRLEVVRFQGGQ